MSSSSTEAAPIATADQPDAPGRNVEIKARLRERAAVEAAVVALGADGPVEIAQDDTFFHCRAGRLKLRDFGDGGGELIFYRRSDDAGAKESSYLRSPTTAPRSLRETLAITAGVSGRVVKQRTLWTLGRTRVHLDRVQGLGDYVELEVVLGEGEAAGAGHEEARRLMTALGIADADCVRGAYVDLLATRDPV